MQSKTREQDIVWKEKEVCDRVYYTFIDGETTNKKLKRYDIFKH